MSRGYFAPSGMPLAKRRLLIPACFEVYLTGACNLRCSYCSSGALVRSGSEALSFGQVRRGMDIFAAACGYDGGEVPDIKSRKIGLTGGEPLLAFDVVRQAVLYARRRYPGIEVSVATNGTLLDREKAAFLLDNGVDLAVSLDGPAAVNDRNRKFAVPGGSVFRRVMDNLSRLPSSWRGRMRLMATFPPSAAGDFARSVKFLRSLGFSSVEADFDMHGAWSASSLAGLRRSLTDLRSFFLGRLGADDWGSGWGDVFAGIFQNKTPAGGGYGAFNEFALSPSGYFYPADDPNLFSGAGGGLSAGSLDAGLSLRRLREAYDGALDCFAARGGADAISSPVQRYFRAIALGAAPGPRLDNGGRVKKIFTGILGDLIEVQRIFGVLASDSDFGDFPHRPRTLSGKEIRVLGLDLRDRADRCASLASARSSADLLLYSPGREKRLVITADPSSIERAKGMLLYSVLKAASLKKRLACSVESSAAILPQDADFIRLHGGFPGRAGGRA